MPRQREPVVSDPVIQVHRRPPDGRLQHHTPARAPFAPRRHGLPARDAQRRISRHVGAQPGHLAHAHPQPHLIVHGHGIGLKNAGELDGRRQSCRGGQRRIARATVVQRRERPGAERQPAQRAGHDPRAVTADEAGERQAEGGRQSSGERGRRRGQRQAEADAHRERDGQPDRQESHAGRDSKKRGGRRVGCVIEAILEVRRHSRLDGADSARSPEGTRGSCCDAGLERPAYCVS